MIGASIAGNYLAYLLSRSNLKIAIIEEHKDIGLPFQCAGIISKKLSQLITLPESLVLNRVSIAKLVAPSGKSIRISGGEEQPYVIDRISFDKFFYNKAKQYSNLTFYLGEKFKSFRYLSAKNHKIIVIITSKRTFHAKILVGCDGPLSLVGKSLGIEHSVIYASQIRIPAKFDQNEAVMWFDPRWKELFAWIVPEGKNIFRIGLASSKNVAKNLKVFLEKLKININEKIDQQGGIIPYGVLKKCSFDNVLLLGDAAGQVKPTTGGGIIMLLIAAKYAAFAIRQCFKKENFTENFLYKNYELPCELTIGKQLRIHFVIRKILENLTSQDFENLFRLVKYGKIEEVLSFYGDMDFPKVMVIKLLKNFLFIKLVLGFIIKKPSMLYEILKNFSAFQ